MGLQNQGKTPGRTTLLEAVNVLLISIGEMPVDNLEREQVGDARVAESTLLEIHKEGQTEGWSWNREEQYPFERDVASKEIVVPANVMEWSPDRYYEQRRYVLRGQRVYDTWNRTYKFDDQTTEIRADVIWLLPWDDVPEVYNRWVAAKAARVFSARVLGSESVYKYTAVEEQSARALLESNELNTNQYNLLTGDYGYGPFPTYAPAAGLVNRRIGSGWRI